MRSVLYILSLVVILFCASFTLANQVFINPSSFSIPQGQNFNANIDINSFQRVSDVYGLEFYLVYDSDILSLVSIQEGALLSSGGSDTVFNHSLINGGVYVYTIRNSTTGIFENGTIVTISFSSRSSGVSNLDLIGVIWVNSSIDNESAGIPSVFVNNATVVVNPLSSSSSSSSGGGSSSSSSSSSSSGGSIINNSSSSGGETNGEITLEIENPLVNESVINETFNNETLGNGTSGFLPLTGRIIDELTSGRVFSSWAFWFVLGLVVVFLSIFIIRRKNITYRLMFWFRKKKSLTRIYY